MTAVAFHTEIAIIVRLGKISARKGFIIKIVVIDLPHFVRHSIQIGLMVGGIHLAEHDQRITDGYTIVSQHLIGIATSAASTPPCVY